MKKTFICSSALFALSFSIFASIGMAQDSVNPLIEMPLPKGATAYGDISGKHLMQYVVEQAKIATDYRDNGHPQFWGRIAGTAADEASAQWLLGKFRQIGLTDVHAQPLNYFLPQWAPKGWSVTLTGGGKTMNLASAQPAYGSPGTDGKEADLEVVYVGAGNEADFAGKDVRGKAVVAIIGPLLHNIGSNELRKRAMDHGAAAILGYEPRDGNHIMQAYPPATTIPAIHLGGGDGNAIRSMIESGVPTHLKIRIDADWVKTKSSLVWGTLPGATDETVYVFAHRDGWFSGSGDNASGVSAMLGLAEHYAKIPKAQRKRTMIFIGTDGHHNGASYGMAWLAANRAKLFAKTALVINGEHPAEMATHPGGADGGGMTTAGNPNEWYAGGTTRPKLTKIALDAFRDFGVPIWSRQTLTGAGGDMGSLRAYVPGVAVESNDFLNMHYETDTPDNVTWAGLEAVTRAYAKIIDEVNKLPLSDLQRPDEPGAAREGFIPSNCQAWINDSSVECVPQK